jgi:hypothetical protein
MCPSSSPISSSIVTTQIYPRVTRAEHQTFSLPIPIAELNSITVSVSGHISHSLLPPRSQQSWRAHSTAVIRKHDTKTSRYSTRRLRLIGGNFDRHGIQTTLLSTYCRSIVIATRQPQPYKFPAWLLAIMSHASCATSHVRYRVLAIQTAITFPNHPLYTTLPRRTCWPLTHR